MKYFKLGLLAVTLSLTALVIALDKKQNINKKSSEACGFGEEDTPDDDSHTIVVENVQDIEDSQEDICIEE